MPTRTLAALAAVFAATAGPAPLAFALDPDQARKDLFFLAGPDCEGRGVQTDGVHKAADYIADQFRRAGLAPGGPDGAYFQPFPIAGTTQLGTPNALALKGPGGKTVELKYEAEFTPVGLSASGKLSAGLVFAGYGITSDDPKYDDYAGLDVKGKWVVLLRQAPGATAKKPPFDPHTNSPHPALVTKLANAVAHKAAGVIFVNHRSEKDDALMPFGYARGPGEGVPVLQIKRAVLEKLFAAVGEKLADTEAAIDADLAPHSFALTGWTATAEVTVTRPQIQAQNVLAVSEGAGPLANETVVIGAHYDHLGRGETGSLGGAAAKGQVHYGADDNASGTTGLLELARRFGAMKDRVGRRIVFAAFSGEERGLFGSQFYAKNPTFPLSSTVFMLNMDMIGRSVVIESGGPAAVAGAAAVGDKWKQSQRLVINGTKTAEGLEAVVAEQTKDAGFALVTRGGGTGPSDHDSFYRKGVPVLFLYTGSHRDYHRPTDTPEKVDLPGLLKIVGLVEALANRLATAPDRPKYVKIAESWIDPTEPASSSPRRGGPKLGIMPGNYESADGGVLVDDVSPGGAAEKGGIKAGDVIIEIAGKPVKNIGGYMAVMAAQKANQEIDVTVVRKDKKVGVKVVPKE